MACHHDGSVKAGMRQCHFAIQWIYTGVFERNQAKHRCLAIWLRKTAGTVKFQNNGGSGSGPLGVSWSGVETEFCRIHEAAGHSRPDTMRPGEPVPCGARGPKPSQEEPLQAGWQHGPV